MAPPDEEWLANRFHAQRPRLQAVARRILGSAVEAEDAVQEAWLRLSRSDAASIENLEAWLTTVVSRVCLDQLRRRKVRGEKELDEEALAPLAPEAEPGAVRELLLAESVEQAMILVLDRLAPAERVAFVLHDLFDLPFADIARILDRTAESVRQLASRARKRVQVAREGPADVGQDRRRIVEAFLAASRQGDLSGLLQLLDAQVALKADPLAVQTALANRVQGAPLLGPHTRGAAAVAEAFRGKAHGARLALVGGEVGAAWVHEGRVRAAFIFKIQGHRIREIDLVMEPARLEALAVQLMAGRRYFLVCYDIRDPSD